LAQYSFNMELVPQRSDLERMSQKQNESFIEYAYRWRKAASRLKTPLTEEDLITSFLRTLKKRTRITLSWLARPYRTFLLWQEREQELRPQLRQGPCKIFWGRAVAPELWRLALRPLKRAPTEGQEKQRRVKAKCT
jgi:hypothetical protein